MKEIILWNVYYMKTNSKKDIWTQDDFLTGKVRKNKIGEQKLRLTIPIQKLRTLNSGEKIYLVCQINSNSRGNSLQLPYSLFQQNSRIHGSFYRLIFAWLHQKNS